MFYNDEQNAQHNELLKAVKQFPALEQIKHSDNEFAVKHLVHWMNQNGYTAEIVEVPNKDAIGIKCVGKGLFKEPKDFMESYGNIGWTQVFADQWNYDTPNYNTQYWFAEPYDSNMILFVKKYIFNEITNEYEVVA